MNIFVTNSCPILSAEYLDYKRVVKMILESAQMLNTTTNILYGESMGYKITHRNHPCTIWVRNDPKNYYWLVRHFEALCIIYKLKYNKIHACHKYLEFFKKFITDTREPKSFVNCTKNQKDISNVFSAYKECLIEKWAEDENKKYLKRIQNV